MATVGASAGINLQEIFAGIKDARASFDANYIRDGHYLFRVDKIEVGKSRSGKAFMAVNLTTLYQVVPNGLPREHRVGEQVTHMLTITGNDSFLGNVKSMISHLMEVPPEDVGMEECMQLVAPDQPLAGSIIEVIAVSRPKKTKPSELFTHVNYKRTVSPEEAMQTLPKTTQDMFFPNGKLQKLAEFFAREAAANKKP